MYFILLFLFFFFISYFYCELLYELHVKLTNIMQMCECYNGGAIHSDGVASALTCFAINVLVYTLLAGLHVWFVSYFRHF